MNSLVLVIIGVLVLLLVILALSAIRVVQQYERGVIFVLGRLTGAKGPGLFLVPPFVSRMSKVDLRIVTLTVPPQEVITRDNVTIKVTAVLYFYVTDPIAAVVNVVNFNQATTQIGQTTLRNVLGQSELDELLTMTIPYLSTLRLQVSLLKRWANYRMLSANFIRAEPRHPRSLWCIITACRRKRDEKTGESV